MTIDSAAAVVLFAIALELFSLSTALISGLLTALSPQFAYFSVLLLPDSLIVFPILLALYFVLRSRRHYSVWWLVIAGSLVGCSCWLRANALLLPIFLAVLVAFMVPKRKRLTAASAIIAGAILVIAPITIKNAVVFHRFIPLSLGAGQTLLEGIADYDQRGVLNIPTTDLGLIRQEAQLYGNPAYADGLFSEDAIDRDRKRIARGFAVIRAHPFWFASVILRRGFASMRLDPVPRLSSEPPVSHPLNDPAGKAIWEKKPDELLNPGSEHSSKATFTLVDNQWLRINGDETNYGSQLISELINVDRRHDYVIKLPFKLEQGRATVKVIGIASATELASVVIDPVEGLSENDQPVNPLVIPFVSSNNSHVRFAIANNASVHPVMALGTTQLIDLGESKLNWTRYLRMPLGFVQRFFTTAVTLPFVIIGLLVLIRRGRLEELAALLVVPAYYLIVQSALHTERRYVYIIHFFFVVLLVVALTWIGESVGQKLRGSHLNTRDQKK